MQLETGFVLSEDSEIVSVEILVLSDGKEMCRMKTGKLMFPSFLLFEKEEEMDSSLFSLAVSLCKTSEWNSVFENIQLRGKKPASAHLFLHDTNARLDFTKWCLLPSGNPDAHLLTAPLSVVEMEVGLVMTLERMFVEEIQRVINPCTNATVVIVVE